MKREEKIKLEQLFKIMKQGNNEVIQELYKRYNKIVYGIAFSILKNKEDSEDVVQKVFLKLYNIDERKLPKEKAGTWLYSVTKNEALTILRKKYDDISLENIYNCENANDEISDFIDKESYNKIISKLSEKEQKVVSLKILSNLTFEEISEVLGESINTVKWRYYKAIYTLKIALSNLGMFIITFILGIATLKEQKKEETIIKEEQNFDNNLIAEDTEKTENNKVNTNEVIQDNENTNSFGNVVIEDTNINTTNYLSIGMFSISAIFLIITIISSIFLTKHQLKAKKKTSK